jgi:hypothetical protein
MAIATEPTITEHEVAQIERALASSATPVVFVHGLWLLPSSWNRWVTLFEEAGYVALTPGWPDIPRRSPKPESTLRCSLARGSARLPTTRRRSSAAWIASP